MSTRPIPAATPFLEARRTERLPLLSEVRLGWINDEKCMEYLSGRGVDISSAGVGLWTSKRLRISALVHVHLAGREVFALGRVRNCVPWGSGWRAGIELLGDVTRAAN